MKHYRNGGSTAARKLACPGWRKLADAMPESNTSSSFAEEGTILHYCMENILEDGWEIDELDVITTDGITLTIDDDHREKLTMALEAWDEFCKEHKIVDYKCEITYELDEDTGGTCDIIAWSNDTVWVVDWKFGQGIKVSAPGSAQGMFYLMCAMFEEPELFEGKYLGVAIIQPIPSRDVETLDVWELDDNDLDNFKRKYLQANGDNLAAGKHCQFCPAAPTCPQKTGQAQAALIADPEALATLAGNLTAALELKDWIKQVETFCHEQLEAGAQVQGYKLVQKRATRKWSDAEAVELALRKSRKIKLAEFTKSTLLTPPQLEKVFKKKDLDMSVVSDYIEKVSSGTTVATADDPREEITLNANVLRGAIDRLS